ncbi:hypothetical protein OPT61_g4820 [Boeremia exigua]|uniref:Uncharacterized protein n=1 Tax=Boeremia exigua TaxID=749465 RepID=A0ACC2ICQ5_9PLEO|nr:hypothetical protein OPT61_g4820 [Boeremia exigua]
MHFQKSMLLLSAKIAEASPTDLTVRRQTLKISATHRTSGSSRPTGRCQQGPSGLDTAKNVDESAHSAIHEPSRISCDGHAETRKSGSESRKRRREPARQRLEAWSCAGPIPGETAGKLGRWS